MFVFVLLNFLASVARRNRRAQEWKCQWRCDKGAVRTPCVAAGSVNGHGVLSTTPGIGFADDQVPLKMTD